MAAAILLAAQIYAWAIIISMGVAVMMTVVHRFLSGSKPDAKPPG